MLEDELFLNESWTEAPTLTAIAAKREDYDVLERLAAAAEGYRAGYEAGREAERQAARDRAEHERCVDAMHGRGEAGNGDESLMCFAEKALENLLETRGVELPSSVATASVLELSNFKLALLAELLRKR